jgi:hypothetical protein
MPINPKAKKTKVEYLREERRRLRRANLFIRNNPRADSHIYFSRNMRRIWQLDRLIKKHDGS